MAMTKSEELQSVHVEVHATPMMPDSEPTKMVTAIVRVSWDDPDDSDLPISKQESRVFVEGDDVSGQDQLVQDICAAVWTDA